MRKRRVTSPLSIKVSPADRKLFEFAAGLTEQPVSTWARGVLLMMALWQTEGEDFDFASEHVEARRRMELMGVKPLGKGRPLKTRKAVA